MALRREELLPESDEVQAARARSLEGARRQLADPELRARLVATIARLDGSGSKRTMTGAEFLASTEHHLD